MANGVNMDLTPVFHKTKERGEFLVNTIDVEKFLKKNKGYSLKDPRPKKKEESKK